MNDDLGRLADRLPGLVWHASPDGRAEFLNKHWQQYTGLSLDPSATEWQAAIHPEDLPHWRERFGSTASCAEPWELELRLRRSDGAYRWFLCRMSPETDPTGEIIRWCGIGIDIDDRRRAENHLREIETSFSGWVESFPGLMVTMNMTGQVELFSREVLDYFGKTREELRNWAMTDAVHPDDLPRVVAAFTESVTSGKPYTIEHRCRRADGVYRWFQVRALAVQNETDQITGWYVVLVDIDDVKRAATELQRASDALRELQATMSRAAQVATVGELAASIAHEVNQPLAGVIMNAGTCLRRLDADPPNIDRARESARRTIRDGDRAKEVIARLRALFSKKEFSLEALDLNEATREVIALSLSDLKRNHVILQTELADDLPAVTGDRIQLQQVILNLLRNASDAMAQVYDGPRFLLIKTGREAGDQVRLTVRDVGVGFDHQIVDKLFDAFYTTKSGGMGVGLSISRSIIERHHGRIWATPNDDRGATFGFAIPCKPAQFTELGEYDRVKPGPMDDAPTISMS